MNKSDANELVKAINNIDSTLYDNIYINVARKILINELFKNNYELSITRKLIVVPNGRKLLPFSNEEITALQVIKNEN